MPATITELVACSARTLPDSWRTLQTLAQQGVPIAPTLVVSPDFFATVSASTGLEQRIKLWYAQTHTQAELTHLLNELRTIVQRLELPESEEKAFFSLYQTHLQDRHIRVFAADTTPHTTSLIQGETTCIQEILDEWYKHLSQAVHALNRHPELITELTVIVQAVQPRAIQGTAFTTNHLIKDAKTLTILAGTNSETPNTYTIDIRTGTCTQQLISNPASRLDTRVLDHLTELLLPLKRQFFGDHRVQFQVSATGGVELTSISAFTPPENGVRASAPRRRTPLSIAVSNPLLDSPKDPSGVLISGSYTLASIGTHPKVLLSSPTKRSIWHRKLTQTIETYRERYPHQPLWYQPFDLTHSQLSRLRGAPMHSPTGPINPSFNQRGSWYYVHHPEAFDFQASIIASIARTRRRPIAVLVPWVRALFEFEKIRAYSHLPQSDLWFELGSAQLLLQPESTIRVKPAGVVIALELLVASMLGCDPLDEKQLHTYTHDTQTLHTMIQIFATKMHARQIPTRIKVSRRVMHLAPDLAQIPHIHLIVPASYFDQMHAHYTHLEQELDYESTR